MTFKLDIYKGIKKLLFFLIPFFLLINNTLAIEQFTAHGGPVKGLAVSNNNKYLASASFDYSVVIWNLNPIKENNTLIGHDASCLLYTSPSPRDATLSRMPSSA